MQKVSYHFLKSPGTRKYLMIRVQLISPLLKDKTGYSQIYRSPNTGLALLAALTPPDIFVSILDEMYDSIDFDHWTDLIGISVTSKTAARAYEIADQFRKRRVPVVLGGIHPTIMPEEALQHADAVVIGEAEETWNRVLDDCKKGQLKPIYRSSKLPSLDNLPFPKRELFRSDRYDFTNLLQTSRGCPYSCHFCSISRLYGKGVRVRPVEQIIAEIKSLPGERLFFIDDNIVGNPEHAKTLLSRLVPLKKKWIAQASVTVTNDETFLKLLHKSGCQGLFIGFESTSLESLEDANKKWNAKTDYYESVRKLHDNGISLVGSFIVGFDSDRKSCFERLLDFIVKSKMEAADLGILTPYPGTFLYDRFKKERRLIDDHWWLKYKGEDVVFLPKQMTREELYEGWVWMMREFHKSIPTFKRMLTGIARRSVFANVLNYKVNIGYRRNAYAVPDDPIKLSTDDLAANTIKE
jgi:radical SAM superfamily enzyme YgiQ (UPF0313 family)